MTQSWPSQDQASACAVNGARTSVLPHPHARAAAIPSGAIQVRFKRSLMNHLDPARVFHLADGEPGPVAK